MTKLPTTWPNWTPSDLKAWIERRISGVEAEKWPQSVLDFHVRLATDIRMHGFWNWHGDAIQKTRLPFSASPKVVCLNASEARNLPGKPGNMTPAKREEYLKNVRRHAGALLELLNATKFDRNTMDDLSDEDLEGNTLRDWLPHWGDVESGHVFAFYVDGNGDRYRLNYDYPNCALVETLNNLVAWTALADRWDDDFLKSSAPIAQTDSVRAKIVFFTCTMADKFRNSEIDIPPKWLAELTNVALELSDKQSVGEETVRKQLQRYRSKQKKQAECDAAE